MLQSRTRGFVAPTRTFAHRRRPEAILVNRPKVEPGFRLDRTEAKDRHINHTMHAYAADDAHGTRYQGNGSGPEPE